MKISSFCLPAVAIGIAVSTVTFTEDSHGFTTLGFALGVNQRDFRTFNNFTDVQANNNQNEHSQFPGYTGADLTIWKACVEWSSELHGNGNGDPSQSGDMGSGGANFDTTFQGNANGPGGVNDNVHSELSGSSGGVLAFTEAPGSNGWRIRYFSGWTWADGPGAGIPGGQIDLQGVACHEYGHALGLGHTGVGGSTMTASISGNGVTDRSIGPDDIAGVQAIYGVANFATKPHIDSITVSGGMFTVTGQNFSATNNRVWFTQATSGGTGEAVKVTGLTSNGTTLTAALPANAGPGDVLVRNNSNGGASLSNPFPFDPGSCPSPTTYCTASPNSVGPGATIGTFGTQGVAANDFGVIVTGLPTFENGSFFYGTDQGSIPFANGTVCVTGSFWRIGVVQADALGVAQQQVDLTNPPLPVALITPGTTWNFQYWYRDPGLGAGSNLSDAVEVTFCD